MFNTVIVFVVKVCLLVSIGYIEETYAEYNDYVSKESEAQDPGSFNSESYEAYNISSKENRINSEDISEMENGTISINNVDHASLNPAEQAQNTNKVSDVAKKSVGKKSDVHYPFSVSIQRKSSHYTSGALVHKQWVLTSAAEFYNVRESIKIFKARLGSVNCKRGGILVPIKQVEIHPSYVHNKPAFDLALLRLGTPVEYGQFVAPITISKIRGRVVSAKFLATYWPRLIVKGQVLPSSAKERVKKNSMRVSTQKLIPWDMCHKLMEKNNVTLEPSSLCLEPIVSHHTPCMPDPGAPVLANDGLWGTTSGWTAKRCLASVSPTVVTRLSSPRVHSWLQLLLIDL